MIRYRPAISRPGRNRPSPNWYFAGLEWCDAELRDDGGFGGSGEVTVAKSSVATSSGVEAGLPQEEQKRPAAGMSVPQNVHEVMIFPIQSTASGWMVREELARAGRTPCFYWMG